MVKRSNKSSKGLLIADASLVSIYLFLLLWDNIFTQLSLDTGQALEVGLIFRHIPYDSIVKLYVMLLLLGTMLFLPNIIIVKMGYPKVAIIAMLFMISVESCVVINNIIVYSSVL